MMINPGAVLSTDLSAVPLPFAFAVSGLAFALLFLQTGLDRARVHHLGETTLSILTAQGAIYGTIDLAILGLLAWLLTRLFRDSHSLRWTLRAFALSYSATLVFGILGLAANVVLGWNTAVAFGVTGVLWALYPLLATLQAMTRGRLAAGIVLVTIFGALLLFGWANVAAS